MTCQMPGAAWQKVWRRPLGSSVGVAVAAKTTPDVPIVAETEPGVRMPMPDCASALVACTGGNGCVGFEARGGGAFGRDARANLGAFKELRQP